VVVLTRTLGPTNRLALTKIDEAISARVGTLARMLRLTFLLASFIAFALPRETEQRPQ
jgi:hypothetical protein